jgi:hypothetical protein
MFSSVRLTNSSTSNLAGLSSTIDWLYPWIHQEIYLYLCESTTTTAATTTTTTTAATTTTTTSADCLVLNPQIEPINGIWCNGVLA